ncbi:MAG: glycosyl transferase, family 2 [Actinomycetia bacterium]|nr:glycosyl transferase, family 2 [Actinomycetes bacterium]
MRPWTAERGPGARSVPLTVIVMTWNEELNIRRCLASVGWADQVVVVDSGSTDRTAALAREAGAEVVEHLFVDYGSQRQWSLELDIVRNDWVLFVDADEWVSDELAAEIAGQLQTTTHAGYAFRLRLIFQDRWIRHAGWYANSLVVRLVRRDRARCVGAVSERLVVDGSVGRLHHDIVDEDLKPFEAWLAKHNRYSSLKAAERLELLEEGVWTRVRRGLRAQPRRRVPRELAKSLLLPRVPLSPLLVFTYLAVLRGGVLDGVTGLRFCSLHAGQELAIRMKVDEARRRRP